MWMRTRCTTADNSGTMDSKDSGDGGEGVQVLAQDPHITLCGFGTSLRQAAINSNAG